MSWVTLSTTDVLAAFSAPEKAAYDAAAAADNMAAIVADVAEEVRGYVGVKASLPTGSTIPARLVSTAVAVARYRFLASLPSQRLITDARQREYNDALRRLQSVASGTFAIDDATTGETQTVSPRFTDRTRYFSRGDYDGI